MSVTLKLNKNEHIVLNALRKNPYLSQKELSESLKLSRPSVANYISSLQQKCFILILNLGNFSLKQLWNLSIENPNRAPVK